MFKMHSKSTVEKRIKDIKRKTRRRFNTEEKIRIVLEGIKGETSIAELCRREGIAENNYYRWSKDFLEAGKRRLKGDTLREATSSEVKDLKRENIHLKQLAADLLMKNDVFKKSLNGLENEWEIK
jgi:transposase|tara:strand:+ start:80 stop:454 length:375 start_codon:yes stop_codon:yes gene_type:complete